MGSSHMVFQGWQWKMLMSQNTFSLTHVTFSYTTPSSSGGLSHLPVYHPLTPNRFATATVVKAGHAVRWICADVLSVYIFKDVKPSVSKILQTRKIKLSFTGIIHCGWLENLYISQSALVSPYFNTLDYWTIIVCLKIFRLGVRFRVFLVPLAAKLQILTGIFKIPRLVLERVGERVNNCFLFVASILFPHIFLFFLNNGFIEI